MDSSQPGSSVHRILQVRILKWVVNLPPGDLPDLGIKPTSPVSPALAGRSFTTEPSRKPLGLGKSGNTYISKIQHIFLQSVHDLLKFGGNCEKFLSYSLCVLSDILYQISFCGQNNLYFYENK